ncbi:DUF3231 family protein [Cytobacillus firmus]|uniref:DUF3231 family protein n=1 Tax=Cytobacillus firmus TaxID=1399 RepID=UPI0018CFCE87|nr:DUF3231 family protein [Cytobacillus firmus]MDD9311645.1 DUF3231 family protein [Cytobacillus firmus]MED1942241.1 DUF3231 family protein [Cytobacillus firmus]
MNTNMIRLIDSPVKRYESLFSTLFLNLNSPFRVRTDFLLKEGVPLPLTNAEKPLSNPDSVPEGVKLTDDEIANLISVKIAVSITFCAQAMIKTVRSDVGLMLFTLQVHLMEIASPLKNLMKERGWLRIPPSYMPPGTPERN